MTQKKLKLLVNTFTVIATVILFALICLVVFQMINRTILDGKKVALQKELSSLSSQIENIENQNNNLLDDTYLEQYAREYYGYGKNNEKQFSADI